MDKAGDHVHPGLGGGCYEVANALLLKAAESRRARTITERFGPSRRVVRRFVAGEDIASVSEIAKLLVRSGTSVTIDVLGESITEPRAASSVRQTYLSLIPDLDHLGTRCDYSIKLSALGQGLGPDGERSALEHAEVICAKAAEVGASVTVDMEDSSTIDSTLRLTGLLRRHFPNIGSVLQANLHRTEADLVRLADEGARIRLVKGAYRESPRIAYKRKLDVDESYLRCLGEMMKRDCYPMVATHDRRMIIAAQQLAAERGRGPEDFEIQMLYGVRPAEQEKVLANGCHLRTYLPFGPDWYAYFMRRLAERPANLMFFARALLTK